MFDTVPAEWVAEFHQSGGVLSALSEASADDGFAHYVSSVDGRRILLLAGPFSSAGEARGWIESARTVLIDRGRVAAALNVRVTRLVTRTGLSRAGDLNDLLGIGAPH